VVAVTSVVTCLEPSGSGIEQEAAHGQASVEHVAQQFLAAQHPRQGDGVAGDDRQPAFGGVRGRRERVDGRHLEGKFDAPHAREVDGEAKQVRSAREGRKTPGEGEGEVVLVGWLGVLGQVDHGILERKQGARVHFEGEVQVERAAASLFGVQVDLPGLAQGVGLDEVAFVVDMESVVDRVVLQIGYVSGDIDDRHSGESLLARFPCSAGLTSPDIVADVDDDALLAVCHRVVDAVPVALAEVADWRPAGERAGQYAIDLVADRVVLEILEGTGIGVVSEESGVHRADAPLVAVVDPVDGSTNAARGIPWYATSICVLDDDGPRVAVVGNLASGVRYHAVRGGGAWSGERPLTTSGCQVLRQAVVAVAGLPARHLGWAQFRAFGAAALELCAVGEGHLDAFVMGEHGTLAPWDYLGAWLVCREAGAVLGERQGRDLITRDPHARRSVVAAATPELLDQLLEATVSSPQHTSGR
jgi:myo-inositol-1(or 4)-monophosphatase